MSSQVFKILSKYGLDRTTDLRQRILQLSIYDWLQLSDDLDEYYKSLPLLFPNDITATPLTFCLPAFPAEDLPNLSTHLIMSDRVFLEDPLYDTVAMLGQYGSPDTHWAISKIGRKRLLINAESYINFYLRAKELILEGRLNLFKKVELPSFHPQFESAFLENLRKDKKFKRWLNGGQNVFLLNLISSERAIRAMLLKKQDLEFVEYLRKSRRVAKAADRYVTIYPLMTSFCVFAITGGLEGLSTDFIRSDYAYVFRRALETAEQINLEMAVNDRMLLPANFSVNGIQVPILQNVPIERVLETISQEASAFEAFRSVLNEKLLNLSSVPMGGERERQILAIKEAIGRDIAGITLAYEGIQKTFSRRLAFHIVLGLSSILVGGFSTMSQNLNALAIAAGIFSGTAISTSIRELAKEWIEYKQELSKLKTRENYFIWRLISKT